MNGKNDDKTDQYDAAVGWMEYRDAERACKDTEDWDVDQLINWSSELDFDNYLADWTQIATSANSEALVGKLKLVLSSNPPLPSYVSDESLRN